MNDLIVNVESSFETAKKETEKRVSELNEKRVDLENAVKSKLSFASGNLKKSVAISKQSYDNLGDLYHKSLLTLFLAVIFVLFYDELRVYLLQYFTWIDNTYQGIPILKLLLRIPFNFNFSHSNQKYPS